MLAVPPRAGAVDDLTGSTVTRGHRSAQGFACGPRRLQTPLLCGTGTGAGSLGPARLRRLGGTPANRSSSAREKGRGFSSTDPNVKAPGQPDPAGTARQVIKIRADERQNNGDYTRAELRGQALFPAGMIDLIISEIDIPPRTHTMPNAKDWPTAMKLYGSPSAGTKPMTIGLNRNLAGFSQRSSPPAPPHTERVAGTRPQRRIVRARTQAPFATDRRATPRSTRADVVPPGPDLAAAHPATCEQAYPVESRDPPLIE
jgi:hypothetical protein